MARKIPIVLHTRELEPITVVELAESDIQAMHERGGVRVALPPKRPLEWGKPDVEVEFRTVVVRAERLHRPDGGYAWLYLSDDDALELPAGILPGQRLGLARARRG